MEFNFCTKNFPLVVLTMIGVPDSEKEMEDFFTEWRKIYTLAMEKNQRYKLLFDVRKSGTVKFVYMKMMADFLIQIRELTNKWMDRTGILVTSPTIQMLIKFVFNFYKAVRPFKVFTNVEECFKWVNSNEKGDEVDNGTIKNLPAFNPATGIDFSS